MILPGSRVGGIGPTPDGEQPHHHAARVRTPEERAAVAYAMARRLPRLLEYAPAADCPTCGRTFLEPHPTHPDVTRCVNCKEHLHV